MTGRRHRGILHKPLLSRDLAESLGRVLGEDGPPPGAHCELDGS
jgi:hypothetical protein